MKDTTRIPRPPISLLREYFTYDPLSGDLRRAKKIGVSRAAGELATSLKQNTGYLHLKVKGRYLSAHRVAWAMHYGAWPKGDLDHINCVRSDNRIANLRIASRYGNTANAKIRKDNTSGYKGVTWQKECQKWQSQIMIRHKKIHLGLFDCPKAAHEAYVAAAKVGFGEFARAA